MLWMKLAAMAVTGFPAMAAEGVGVAQLRPVAYGILLGLGAAAPIGPVNVEIARRALRVGFWAGVTLGLGAVTVDVFYALITALSFIQVLNRPTILITLAAAGACLLAFLGIQCLRAAWSAWRTDPLATAVVEDELSPKPVNLPAAAPRTRSAYLTGLLMTLLNPMTIGFWLAVAFAAAGTRPAGEPSGAAAGQIPKATADDLPMVCIGVFLGTTAWVFAFSGLLAWAARRAVNRPDRRRKWLAAADVAGGATLLVFAGLAFLRLFRSIS
jgi:threonine/homoserine/homoserine lactone efflux protein